MYQSTQVRDAVSMERSQGNCTQEWIVDNEPTTRKKRYTSMDCGQRAHFPHEQLHEHGLCQRAQIMPTTHFILVSS